MSASIEIPGRSSIHNSEQDFVVISESPVVQLSEGDVLDGLEVKMDSFGVQSISLKEDIEKLTRENEQLKQTALSDGLAIKKHLQLCTEYKEQMTKCHERDAAMLEEARQATLKLQDENSALNAVLENVRCKLEEAVVNEFSLKQSKLKLESELEKLRSELAVSQTSAEEARQRADEASFVRIEGGPTETEDQLRAEIAELTTRLDEQRQKEEDEDSLVQQLEAKVKTLSEELAAAHNFELLLDALNTSEIANLMETHKRLTNETATSTEAPDGENETITTANLQEVSRDAYSAGVASQTRLLEAQTVRLSEVNSENDLLREKFAVLTEEKRVLAAKLAAIQEESKQVVKDHLAAISCLQNESASQAEALKLALRSEQTLREKAETNYANLLETWQSFERNYEPPVDLGDELTDQQSDVARAAQNLATADRFRLEADVRMLRETVKDLQAQNMRLLEERQLNTVQQAGSSSRAVERRCPICMQHFEDQNELIQHAGICDNELGHID